MNIKYKYVLIIPLSRFALEITHWDKMMNPLRLASTLTFSWFSYFLLYLLKEIVLCMHFALCVCVCVFKQAMLCLLPSGNYFFLCEAVFVISTWMWTNRSSFSCAKEISQLLINRRACCGSGQDFRKSSFSPFHMFFYRSFHTADLFVSNVYHLTDRRVTSSWKVSSLCVWDPCHSTLWGRWQHSCSLLWSIWEVSWENQEIERGCYFESNSIVFSWLKCLPLPLFSRHTHLSISLFPLFWTSFIFVYRTTIWNMITCWFT